MVDARYPLDVLLVCGHMHTGASTSYGLHKYLENHPAVRSYGITNNKEKSLNFLRQGLVNTIFINPCFPGEWWPEPAHVFIEEVRKEFPNVCFVLYADQACLSRFFEAEPRYKHFFQLEEIYGFQDDEGFNKYIQSILDSTLRRCEEWYATRYEYDAAISFAGEDRSVAEMISARLKRAGIRVFYDSDEQSDLLGKDLFTYLFEIYSRQSRYCVMLISKNYLAKVWTIHERRAAQERTLAEKGGEYIIPVRLDASSVPGLASTIGYVEWKADPTGHARAVDLIVDKLRMIPSAQRHKKYIGRSLYGR